MCAAKCGRMISERALLAQIRLDLADGHTHLLHRVALAHGHAVVGGRVLVADGLEVKGDAERRADLVLAAIALADGAGLVVIDHELLAQLGIQLLCGAGEDLLLAQRQDRGLERRERGMEVQHHAHIVLAVLVLPHDLLVVGVAQHGQHAALHAEARLDDIGDILHHVLALALAVDQLLAARVGMLRQVVVRAVGDAPKLAPAEGEEVLEVGGCLGIEAKLLGGMVTESEMLLVYAETKKEVTAVASPVLEPLKVGAGLAEELKLHLLELSYTEDKVAWSDLVSERLTYLTNAERNLFTCGSLNVVEVYENTLSSLGTEIKLRLGILSYALEGLEHKVELADIGEILLAALGALDIMLVNVVEHLLICPACNVCAVKILDELVCTVTGLALLAVHERVGEAADVTGSHPCLGVHKDSGVKTYVVGALLNELLLPSSFDIVLQLNAEGTVVPCVGEAAVDFTSGIYKASAFTERYDLVHSFFCCHNNNHLLCPQANFFPQWGILTVTFNYIPYRGCCQEINFRLSLDYQWLKQSIELQIRWNQSSNDDWNESLAELSRS